MRKWLPVVLVILAAQAQAANIPISSETQIKLGSGIDPVTGSRKNDCIDFKMTDLHPLDGDETRPDSDQSKDRSGVDQKIYTKVITSNSEAYSFLNIEVSAKASYLAYSGSGSYSQTERSYQRSDRMSIALSAAQDYGRFELSNYHLKPEYLKLAMKADKSEFYARCGREFVVGYRLGQGLKVLLSSSNDLSKSYKEIHISAQAAAGGSNGGGSVSASFEQIAEQMLKIGSLEVAYRGFGTGELKTSSVFLNNKADVDSFSSKVEKFTSELSPSTAVKTDYITKSYDETITDHDQFSVDVRRNLIAQLYADYVSVRDDLSRLLNIDRTSLPIDLPNLCAMKDQMSCGDYLDLLGRKKLALEKAQLNVISHINACVKNTDISDCRGLSISELYPDLQDEILWPKQYRRVLYRAFLRIQGSKR